jgi:hypothetical protein
MLERQLEHLPLRARLRRVRLLDAARPLGFGLLRLLPLRRARHHAAQLALVDADVAGRLLQVPLGDRLVLEAREHRRDRTRRVDPALDGVDVVPGDRTLDRELHERPPRRDHLPDGRVARALPQVARVHAAGADRDVGLRQEPLLVVEGPPRGTLPGLVAVEREDDLAGERVGRVEQEPAQHPDVLGPERGTAGRDRHGDAREMAGHDVGVPLDDDHPALLGDLAAGEVDPVEHLRLLVQGRLGRVEVLRAVVVLEELAGAETDDRPRRVPDRPDQPPPEAVDELAGARRLRQPGLGQLLDREPLGAQVLRERVPRVRSEPAAERRRGVAVEAAAGEELPGDGGVGPLQLLTVERRGRGVGVQQALLETGRRGAAPRGTPVRVLIGQLEADASGQPLDGLDETEPVELGEERDRVAAHTAPEAVIHAARGGDVETRRPLVVKGAQALEVAATGIAQGDALADDLGDVGALAHQLNVGVTNPARHRSPRFRRLPFCPPGWDTAPETGPV